MSWKFRTISLGMALVLLLIAGCAFFQRKRAPGPDGKYGTADDIILASDAENTGEAAKSLADLFGFGWLGLAIQGASIVATNVGSTRKGLIPV